MWLLFMVSISGIHHDVFLERYNTRSGCESEQVRIAEEMAISYPTDTDMQFVCRYREHST